MSFADITNIEETANTKDNIRFGDRVLMVLEQQRRSKTWLAEQIGMTKQAINYLLNHSTTPKYVNEIAAALEINPEWLLFGKARQQINSDADSGILRIPVFLFEKVAECLDRKIQSTEFTHLAGNTSTSKNCFATIIPNKSMEPLFNEGTLLVFNPDIEPKASDYILLVNENEIFFRQYFVDGSDVYLRAIDMMYKSFKKDEIKILGVLIESRNQFR